MKNSQKEDAIPLMKDDNLDQNDGSTDSFDFVADKATPRNIARSRLLNVQSHLLCVRARVPPWLTRRLAFVLTILVLGGIGWYLFFVHDWEGPGILRPGIHFSAGPGSWLNDPNGLFRDGGGTWHMYYQHLRGYEPDDCKNWAHTTSTDLYSWTWPSLALKCTRTSTKKDTDVGIWSGSIVIDTNNTSGLLNHGQDGGVIALYTEHGLDTGFERQSIAYSTDNGLYFDDFEHNPVLTTHKYDFRDPKVIWHAATEKWAMVVAVSAKQLVEIYTSDNLREWELASTFTNPSLSDEHPSFECPNLVEMPVLDATQLEPYRDPQIGLLPQSTMWMLTFSSGSGHPGRPGGGSVVRYFPGDFNGTHFTPVDTRTDRLLDHGPDFYATQFWYNGPLETGPISISWAANLHDCDFAPSGEREQWCGMMTLPRNGMLMRTRDGDIRYLSRPANLKILRKRQVLDAKNITSNTTLTASYKHIKSGALVIDMQLALHDPQETQYRQNIRSVPSIAFSFKSSLESDTLRCVFEIHKGGPHFSCATADGSKSMGMAVPLFNEETRRFELQMTIDRSIIEVFLNQGIRTGTMTVWPQSAYKTFELETTGWDEDVGKVQVAVQELEIPNIDNGAWWREDVG